MGFRFSFILSAIFLSGILFWLARPEPTQDKQALLDFASSANHSRPLNWDAKTPVCDNWIGITCDHDHSRIIALRLPGYGFRGPIPLNTIGRLSGLEILSLRSNGFSGPFPQDFYSLGNLTSIYLQFNNFEGSLPQNFSAWKYLSVINWSNNAFNGSIPSSLSNLTHLTALSLSDNLLSGRIPDLNVPSLQLLDLSHNNFTGDVPPSLSRFPISAFVGNQLAFQVSSPPSLPPRGQQSQKSSSKLGEAAILAIIIGCSTLGFVIITFLFIVCLSNKGGHKGTSKPKQPKKEGSLKKEKKPVSSSPDGDGRLVFSESCKLAFDLEDLLRASAEVLGKGTFGTTYKAALEDGTTVVVKRLKEATVGKREFELQMQVVGTLQHENVSPLRAYYYSKEEKLMVYDHYVLGSVSSMLHGKRGEKRIPLDWETRLRIAIGAARGIAHIHIEYGGKLVHGNIKASNIFLNSQLYGCVSDLGLATMITPMNPQVTHLAGYRAPELRDNRKASQASDVYSFGVLLLELLTGKSPMHATGGDEVVHLVKWVKCVVREEWTAEVFDVELLRYPNIEEELVQMLQIGMACVARTPEQRPTMVDALRMMEDIRQGDTGNAPSTETKTGGSTPNLTPLVMEQAASSNPQ